MIHPTLYDISLILLPAMCANAMPIVISRLKRGSQAIWAKVFGDHKTRRWLITAMISGMITLQWLVVIWYTSSWYLQNIFHTHIHTYYIAYTIGAYIWLCVILWDMTESLLKRYYNIPAWTARLPRDKIDYIIGVILWTWVRYDRSIASIILILIIGWGMSTWARLLGYSMWMTREKW